MAKMKTLTINGKIYTVEDADSVSFREAQELTSKQQEIARKNVGAASIDDTKAGPDAWSSKHTVDKLCPAFTESGSIVLCEPVEGYPLEVEWETKNLAKADASRTVDVGGGLVVTATKGSSEIVVNGTATKNHSMRLFYNIVLPAGTYTVWVSGLNGSDYLNSQDAADAYVFTGAGKKTFSLSEKKTINISVVFVSGSAYDNTPVKIQIEKGTAATAYEPYAETATITRRGKNICPYATSEQTNDSGHINFYSGVSIYSGMTLTISADITRYDTAATENGTMRFYIYYADGSRTTGSATYGAEKDGLPHRKVITLTADASKTIGYLRFIPVDKTVEGDRADNIQLETGNTATAYEPYNSGTFAPGDEIPALPGINTLYAGSGLVTVTGRADPTAVFEKLTNAIIAMGGNI